MERFKILKIKEHKATKDNDYYFNLLLKDNILKQLKERSDKNENI